MSKMNPLAGLIGYGDSDDSDDDAPKRSTIPGSVHTSSGNIASYGARPATGAIHPAPIPHCPWSACYDDSSGFTYYWNQQTNAVTWEAPPEYLLALKVAQQQLNTSGTEVSAEEWQLYQQALAEKHNSKGTVKSSLVKPTKKSVPTAGSKQNSKSNKKRPASDDEDEKIELITSYQHSDSDSNDEPESPVKSVKPSPPRPAVKPPKNPVKRQKTKPSTVEYGPPLPPKQNYTVPIGPEFPPDMVNETKPESPKVEADVNTNKEDSQPSTPKAIEADNEDSQDENTLLKKLKDKARLLEKLGGELPSELQEIIQEEIKSNNASPKPIDDKSLDIDDLLNEIEKKELPKCKSKKVDMFVDDAKETTSSKCSATNSPQCSSRDMTPPLEELKNLKPDLLFPSAANIENSEIKPVVEEKKKSNVYLMDSSEVIENTTRKKLRISNSVLQTKKVEKIEVPSYTTKYSQVIDGFSGERTGLGFSKDEEVSSSPKKTINYGNGLMFTKGEVLNEDKRDEELDETVDVLEAKLKYLNQLQPSPITPVQEMLIQLQSLSSAHRAGALAGAWWRGWVQAAGRSLARHEAAAPPPGWTVAFLSVGIIKDTDGMEERRQSRGKRETSLRGSWSEGRYRYRREADGLVQWEYPALADTDMDICTTPPHPPTDDREEPAPLPPLPPLSPVRVATPPPPAWHDPPPPGIDDPQPPPPPPPPPKETKKEIGDELLSFYNDIAELEKHSGPTEPNSPECPPPPDLRETERDRDREREREKDKYRDKEVKASKKKPKVKISSSIGLKHKSVSNLVAKWQQVAEEIHSD